MTSVVAAISLSFRQYQSLLRESLSRTEVPVHLHSEGRCCGCTEAAPATDKACAETAVLAAGQAGGSNRLRERAEQI
jgi:hypothetical protein